MRQRAGLVGDLVEGRRVGRCRPLLRRREREPLEAGEVDGLYVVYTKFLSASRQEAVTEGQVLGQLQTSGDLPTSFTITGGNPSGAFALDPSAGRVT